MEITSTYRLQLRADFTFDDAGRICDYLKHLGISHVYCSPYLHPTKGSRHGYDVVDHNKVNEKLGGEEGLHRFASTLNEHQLGQVLDIVPNHIAIGTRANTLRSDLLENGASSGTPISSTWTGIRRRQVARHGAAPVLGDHDGGVAAFLQWRA